MSRAPYDTQSLPLQDHQAISEQVEIIVRSFPRQLRQFRESLNLTQYGLSRLIGVDETTAYRLEQGKLPSFRTYTAILLLGFSAPSVQSDQDSRDSLFKARFAPTEHSKSSASALWSRVKD